MQAEWQWHCHPECQKNCRQGKPCCWQCPSRVAELCRRFKLCRRGECLCTDLDTVLMAAFADGDENAFRVLYERNISWALKLAWQFVRHREEAEDIVQDAFLRLIAARPRWRATARFQTWFHRIVIRLAWKRQHQKSRRAFLPLEALAETEDAEQVEELPFMADPETQVVDRKSAADLEAFVKEVLQTLPPRQRNALSLWAQGYSYRQIARTLNCSVSAVESLLHRARTTLRERLRRWGIV